MKKDVHSVQVVIEVLLMVFEGSEIICSLACTVAAHTFIHDKQGAVCRVPRRQRPDRPPSPPPPRQPARQSAHYSAMRLMTHATGNFYYCPSSYRVPTIIPHPPFLLLSGAVIVKSIATIANNDTPSAIAVHIDLIKVASPEMQPPFHSTTELRHRLRHTSHPLSCPSIGALPSSHPSTPSARPHSTCSSPIMP